MNRALPLPALVASLLAATLAAVGVGCERVLNEKHVWVASTRGLSGGAGALVDGPLLEATHAFAKRNGLAVTTSSAPCAEPACDLELARAAGAGTVLSAEAQGGGLELRLIDAAAGSTLGQDRVPDASASAAAVDRLLYARFGGTPATPPGSLPRLVELPLDAADAGIEDAAPPEPVARTAKKPSKPEPAPATSAAAPAAAPVNKVAKGKAGVERKRGEANGGTLILMSDALLWQPGGLNLSGARAQRFSLADVKRIFVERGQLVVQASWGPKYTFDTKEDEMRWRNAIDDARSAWTGKPKDE